MNAMTSGSGSVAATAPEMATKKRGAKTAESEKLGEVLSVRLSESDLVALADLERDLGKTMVPLKRITIARVALRIGIAVLQKDRSRFFEPVRDESVRRGPRKAKPRRA